MTTSPSTELAAAHVRVALLRLALSEAKAGYRADQPRTPAGNHELSGRWSGGAGAGGGGGQSPIERGIGNIQRGVDAGIKRVQAGVAAAGQRAVEQLHTLADPMLHGLKPLGGVLNEAGQAVWSSVPAPIRNEINTAIANATPSVAAFLDGNREAIASTLGSLQAVGGLAQGVEGTDLIMVGMASAPEGLPLAALGGWMIARGYDDWDTGLRTLVSGAPQDGGFYTALRGFGLSDTQAQVALAATAGLPPSALNRLSRQALEAAADRVLVREAASTLRPTLVIRAVDGSAIFKQVDILKRGTAWEQAYAKLTGAKLLPPGTRTFDAVSSDGTALISNKTLDLERDFYQKDKPLVVRARLKAMIDSVADFKPDAKSERAFDLSLIRERRVALLIPAGRARPGQMSQLASAHSYAELRGVALHIYHGE